MHNILLVDTLKSSLVMTSEVFKDCVKGCQINIVNSGKECVDFLHHSPDTDMVVVDFNLPDTDGVVLSRYLKRSYKGPVIITAFPDQVVDDAIAKELFAYHDAHHWVQKPVRLKLFSSVIHQFLNRNRRLSKRFVYTADVRCTTSAQAGGPKLKFAGHIEDISMGGMKIHVPELSLAELHPSAKLTAKFTLPQLAEPADATSTPEGLRIKSQIIWTKPQNNTLGIQFLKMKLEVCDALEESLKYLEPIEDTMDYITDSNLDDEASA